MEQTMLEQFRAAMRFLEVREGSQRDAALACRVFPQSWGQWKRGAIPRVDTMERVIQEANRQSRRSDES